MGNHSSRFGCMSAPIGDGEYFLSSKYSKSLSLESTPPPPPTPNSESESIEIDNYDFSYPHYKMNVKLLFLDVDGVLNNAKTKFDEYTNGIEDELLRYVSHIIIKTGCKVVLSTAWRLNATAKMLLLHAMKVRADLNIDDIIVGQTKSLKYCGKNRTDEIRDFLKRNEYRFNVVSWCALDDMALNKYSKESEIFMHNHFVKTNPKMGISAINTLNCLDILNQNDYRQNTYFHTR